MKEAVSPHAADGLTEAQRRTLAEIARSSVELGALGPRLAQMAADLEQQAQAQAKRATDIADTMSGLTRELDKAVAALHGSSAQVGEALETVKKIADHTRIISLNASIEAARAGLHGRAFAVVVEEVQQLAHRTGDTTKDIGARMQEMQASIHQVSKVTGGQAEQTDLSAATHTVGQVNQEVQGMAQSAEQQLGEANQLHRLSENIHGFTEQLLLSVGTFRFREHESAQRDVGSLLPSLLREMPERAACERVITEWLLKHPHFELAYLTDARGRQFVDNLVQKDGSVQHDASGLGKDWSKRPWYLAALGSEVSISTDLYRSTATQDFCFTVAVALRAETGELLGVLGADVNFNRLCQG